MAQVTPRHEIATRRPKAREAPTKCKVRATSNSKGELWPVRSTISTMRPKTVQTQDAANKLTMPAGLVVVGITSGFVVVRLRTSSARRSSALPAARRNDQRPIHGSRLSRVWRPRQDSNLRLCLRRAPLYPLSYGGSGQRTNSNNARCLELSQIGMPGSWSSVSHLASLSFACAPPVRGAPPPCHLRTDTRSLIRRPIRASSYGLTLWSSKDATRSQR